MIENTQTEAQKKLIAMIEDKYSERAIKMGREIAKWNINKLAYAGHYWVNAAPQGKWGSSYKYVRVQSRHGFVENHVKYLANALLAALTQDKPTITISPSTDETKDIDAAAWSQQFIDNTWARLNIQTVLQRGLLPEVLTGTAFMKVYWDKTAGKKVIRPVSETKNEEGPEGEICLLPIPPDGITFDRYATGPEDAFWMIHSYERNIELVRNEYPKLADIIAPDAGGVNRDWYVSRGVFESNGQMPSLKDEGVIVKELYMKPHKEHPNGLYVKIAGGVLLEQKDLEPEKWPFVKFVYYLSPWENTPWGETPVTDAVAIVKMLNFTMNQLLENMALFGSRQWFLIKNPYTQPGDLNNQPGHTYVGTDEKHKPVPIDPMTPSNEHFNLRSTMIDAIEQITGVNKVMKGQNPTNVRSSPQLAILRDQMATHLTPSVARHQESIRQMVMLILHCSKDNYEDGRILQVVGENGAYKAMAFQASDLTFDDVQVEVSAYPGRTRAEVHEAWRELWDAQIVKDPDVVREKMEMGQAADERSLDQIAREQARRENSAFMGGTVPDFEDYHVHAIHHEEHQKMMSSPNYDVKKKIPRDWKTSKGDIPETEGLTLAQVAKEHDELHVAKIMEAKALEQQNAMAMQAGKGATSSTQQAMEQGQSGELPGISGMNEV